MTTTYDDNVKAIGEIHVTPRCSGFAWLRKKGADYRVWREKLQLLLSIFCTGI
jgi:hypothetical protein